MADNVLDAENGRAAEPHALDDDPTLRIHAKEHPSEPARRAATDGDAAEAGDTEPARTAPGSAAPGSASPGRRGSGRAPATRRPAGVARLLRFLGSLWAPALVLLAVVAAWWVIAWRDLVAKYLVPSPAEVYHTMIDQWALLSRHAGWTFLETVVGFVLACVLGLVVAVAITYSSTLDKALYPLVLFAQVIPKIAIAPVLLIWRGYGVEPKIELAVLIAFFPVVIAGVAGLRSTDPELLDLSATMGASRWNTFRKIRFPNALPHLMAGFKVAVTLAVVGAVVGEFAGGSDGLGHVLQVANGSLDAPLLFAVLIVMSVIGIVLFVAVEAAEALLIPWHASRRADVRLTTS